MITEFRGDYAWASSFWPARVVLDGVPYPTVEHAYQAAKTRNYSIREEIRQAPRAADAKRLGRMIPQDAWHTPQWDVVKVAVMTDLVHQKFTDETLRRLLVATDSEPLQEGNTWGDEFWGVNLLTGKGLNMLGSILMLERAWIVSRWDVQL